MQVIAILALIFGFMVQGILDGQTFAHAVLGIVGGLLAVTGGLVSVRQHNADAGRIWTGWTMAILGLGLALWCSIQLPSAYRFEKKFNERSRKAHEMATETKLQPVPSPPTNSISAGGPNIGSITNLCIPDSTLINSSTPASKSGR